MLPIPLYQWFPGEILLAKYQQRRNGIAKPAWTKKNNPWFEKKFTRIYTLHLSDQGEKTGFTFFWLRQKLKERKSCYIQFYAV